MQKKLIYILFISFMFQPMIYGTKKCNDLILLLDPSENETVEARSTALTSSFMTAIQERAASIVTTANILKNFCFWKTEHKDTLNHIKQIVIETKNDKIAEEKVIEIIKSLEPTKRTTFPPHHIAIPLSLINLSDDDWHCYIHNKANIVLLIPKKYLGNTISHIEMLGFQMTELSFVSINPLESLLNTINKKEEVTVDLVVGLSSLFSIPSPADDTSWNIYLVGHGSPSKKKKDFVKNLPHIETSHEGWQNIINTWRNMNETKKSNAAAIQAKPSMEEYKISQSLHLFNDEDLIPQTAHIAGLSFNDFFALMKTFNAINTSFFYYTTCFGGGYNRIFVNSILQQLNVNFITVAEGYNESSTYASVPTFIHDKNDMLTMARTPFTNFFGRLNAFFGESIINKKTAVQRSLKRDPIAHIISGLIDIKSLMYNQPFVRIPSVGIFQSLNVDKKVKILTHSVVKAYEFENRLINLTNSEIEAILLYPEKINVPITMGSSIKFISPTWPLAATRHNIHVLENITADTWLKFILLDFISLNNSYSKITFVIKNLACFSSNNLNANIPPGEHVHIKNLIIQIVTDLIERTNVKLYTAVKIAFSVDGQDYSFEKSFENNVFNKYDLLAFFEAQTSAAVNTQLLQDMAQVTDENITLPRTVEYLEKQIETTTNVQKIGSLKKVLLLKKLDSIEQATTPQSIEQQIRWLKKKGKPLTIINDRFKKYTQELNTLQQDINRLIQAHDITENEKVSAAKKIASIHGNIQNVDQTIAQKLSTGYISQVIEKIKDTGYQLYEWLSSKKSE